MMFTEKLMKMVHRQTALVTKGEDMTPEEREELTRLNDAIKVATAPVAKSDTRLTTMSQDEFAKYVNEQIEAEQTPDSMALLKRNIENVKAQKSAGKEIFAVELPVEKSADDAFEAFATRIEARIDALEAKIDKSFDARTRTGLDAETTTEETVEESSETTEKEADESTEEEAVTEEAKEEEATEETAKEDDAVEETVEDSDDEEEEEDVTKVDWNADLAKSANSSSSSREQYAMLKGASGRVRE